MKKIIFATLAAAALVACAKEEPIALNQEEIGFTNAFVDGSVRSVDPSTTEANLVGFQVYGTTLGDHTGAYTVNIFNNIAVGYSLPNGIGVDGWKYATNFVQYWIAGNTYNFAAVANAADTAVAVDETPQSLTVGMPVSIAYDAETQKDLLYAEYNDVVGKVSGNDPIAFTFNHLLSKVKFTFKNLSATGDGTSKYTYKVTGIKVYNARKTAVCNVANYNADTQAYSWPTNATDTKYDSVDNAILFGDIVASDVTTVGNEAPAAIKVGPSSQGASLYERLLIPGKYTDLTIECRIELLIGDDVVDVIEYKNPISVGLEGGQAFNFVLTGKVGEPIQFTVNKINDWTLNESEL